MTKIWRCTQCNQTISKGLVGSLSDEPTECPSCGNDELEVSGVTGRLHRLVEDPGGTLQSRRSRRRVLVSGGSGVAVIAGAWWFFGRPTIEQTTEVELENSQFHPRNIEVSVGDEVTWTNVEDTPGDVEDIMYLIRSRTGWDFEADLGEGDSASYTFEEPGIYDMYDEIFGDADMGGMSMRIGVDEEIEDPVGGWF